MTDIDLAFIVILGMCSWLSYQYGKKEGNSEEERKLGFVGGRSGSGSIERGGRSQ